MRALFAMIALVLVASSFTTTSAEARSHRHHSYGRHHHRVAHHHRRHVSPARVADAGGLTTIATAAGPVTLALSIADRMRGFIADVVERGFTGRVHCFASSGHVPHSLHHWGGACDFAQTGWNRTHAVMYRVGDLANKWGLRDGCTFRSRRDCGHVDAGR